MKLAIIGDIHEDIVSLKKALRLIEKRACDEIACMGDIVGFSYPYYGHFATRNATACVQAVKSNCKFSVVGNHDMFAVRRIPEKCFGFDFPPDWYARDFAEREKLAEGQIWLYESNEFYARLGEAEQQYLRSLPELCIEELGGHRLLLTHFLLPDLTGALRFVPTKPKHLADHFASMKELNCSLAFSGHGHTDGVAICYKNKVKFKSFGTHKLKEKRQWIVGPAVANSARPNGFLILDTIGLTLDVIPLGTPPHQVNKKDLLEE